MAAVEAAHIDFRPARKILKQLQANAQSRRDREGQLIPILQEIQRAYGYLPFSVLRWLSSQTGIPTSRMYGVITFYAQFHTKPRGRHTVRCCQGTACHVKGATHLADTIKSKLKIREGETTKDMRFTFETVACLGTCFLAPVLMIDNDYYGRLTPDRISSILEKYE
jgi:NADH-quinone oxidoreductase subunit E